MSPRKPQDSKLYNCTAKAIYARSEQKQRLVCILVSVLYKKKWYNRKIMNAWNILSEKLFPVDIPW